MPSTFSHEFDTPAYKGKTSFCTGLSINGKFVDGSANTTIDIINPATGTVITQVSEATEKDVDLAVDAAEQAFNTTWGLHAPGAVRSALLNKLASLMEQHAEELSALESLDNGKTLGWSKMVDIPGSIYCIKYYAGWADKITGQVIETDQKKLTYTRHEPFGVVGQIIPWNFPLLMLAWKLGPALATGNTIVLKVSELTPLTALRMAGLISEAGFPPGVVNILVGYGHTVGAAISSHMRIDKVAFTGSTLVGRKIMEAAAKSNLKNVTLELGGKSPTVIFDDADLEQAVKWASRGIFWNQGQTCCAGSRIFVQSGIYDAFLEKFTAFVKSIKVGDPFDQDVYYGPQVSQVQYDRIMSYVASGNCEGATLHTGGARHGTGGYFIQPTIFTGTRPDMRIVKEEIFGPVGVVIKFEDEDDVIKQANDTMYGLAAAIFTKELSRAIRVANSVKAGTVWVNCINSFNAGVPFGGFKESGIGRECGEYALANYTNVKAVFMNIGEIL